MINIFKYIASIKSFQGQNRNRALLRKMRNLGFSKLEIRLALIATNQISLVKIKTDDLKPPTLSRTIHGFSKNIEAQKHIAYKLGIEQNELF